MTILLFIILLCIGFFLFLRWGTQWGSTPKERVMNMSGDAVGFTASIAILIFQFIDSIMAIRQLLGIKERVENANIHNDNPETGARDQYQYYETIFASGERVGVQGKEQAAHWRQMAIDDGVLHTQKD